MKQFFALIWVGLIIVGLVGWVMNIIDLVQAATGSADPMGMVELVVRIVGIFVLVLGGIMGYF